MPHEPMPPIEVGDWVMEQVEGWPAKVKVVASASAAAFWMTGTYSRYVIEIRKPSGLVWRRAEPLTDPRALFFVER